MIYKEQKRRSILKTFSWRFFATLATCTIVWIFTGEPLLAVSVGGVEVVLKLILYFFHERLWDKIHYGKRTVEPFVLWFTGLSGSGKSTIANQVYEHLQKKKVKVERLDGDTIRAIFPKTGFTKEDRNQHIRRVGFLASILEKNGVIVIASFVSPYAETRNFVRGLCQNFTEVYVKASLETCEERDVKGLYKKARLGEIQNFTGVSDPYEPPPAAEIVLETDQTDIADSVKQVLKYIDKRLC